MTLTVVASDTRYPRAVTPLAAAPTVTRPLLLAEPHELARMGVHYMLERCAPKSSVSSVTSWLAVFEAVHQNPPAVLLVSTELDGEPDDSLSRQLSRAGTHVVLLVRSSDPRRLRTFLRLPISAVLHEQDFSVDTFDQLLAGLDQGMSTAHSHATRYLLALAADAARPGEPPVNLTARELDALRAIAQGMTNRQIARQMGISEHGVKRHIGNVLAKLHVTNRTMAVTAAIERGLLPQPGAR